MKPASKLALSFLTLVLTFSFALSANDLVQWELVWADEFDTDGRLNERYWQYELGRGENGWGNQEQQVYTDDLENVEVSDGILYIRAQQTTGSRVPGYTSGRVITRERVAVKYGRIEARIKLPLETGTWPAFWMLSNDTVLPGPFWPDNGEIDILETVGYERDPLYLETINAEFLPNLHATVHTAVRNFQTGPGGIGGAIYDTSITEDFHVFAVEWFPTRLDFYIDDLLYVSLDRETDFFIPRRNRPDDISPYWPFQQRFFVILNVAVGGTWGGLFNTQIFPNSPYGTSGIDHDGVWPQVMEVDYVRVYRIAPVQSQTAPGMLITDRYDREYGLLMANSDSTNTELHFHSVQEGDFVEYDVWAASSDTYTLSADLKVDTADRQISLGRVVEGGGMTTTTLPSTSGVWQMTELMQVDLVQGKNTIRVEAMTDGFEMGNLSLSLPQADPMYGYPTYTGNIVDTGDWLGALNLTAMPFIYAPSIRSWLFSGTLEASDSTAGGQYFAVFQPDQLKAYDDTTAPWFYSTALETWFYAPSASAMDDLNQSQWIYLSN